MLSKLPLLILAWLSGAISASAEPALIWGGPAAQAQCEAAGKDPPGFSEAPVDCLRYFVGGPLQNAPLVMVLLRGDRTRWLDSDPQSIPQNTGAAQTQMAQALSERAGLPAVILARPGTFGSGGNHRERRQISEFEAIATALDLLQARYGIGRFVLLGHSGGATAAAAVLTFGRRDIACAVLTSGAFGLLERAEWIRSRAGSPARPQRDLTGLTDPYDPMHHIEGILPDPGREIIVIGHENDQVTPFHLQARFAQRLRAAGHNVLLLQADAQAPSFHNLLGDAGLKAAKDCTARHRK